MHRRTALIGVFLATVSSVSAQKVAAPRIWNDESLRDWPAPVAGINVRPTFFTEREYYATPQGEWVRTYPVYFPGREPAGYWEMLRNKKPEPLIVPGPRTADEWIAAGKRVFTELHFIASRSYDPKFFAIIRSPEEFRKLGGHPQKDGTVQGLRLVPTAKGLALSIRQCAGCHVRTMPDGVQLDGAPDHDPGDGLSAELESRGDLNLLKGESPAMMNWRRFAVPWIPNDIHGPMKTMRQEELDQLLESNIPGTIPRFNGSPYFTTKIPDLIGVGERKYIDATATHRLRSPEDIARYAALITCCDAAGFGPYHILSDKQRVIQDPFSDDLLYALAQYIVSLKPPENPNRDDPRSALGAKIFEREGCSGCHTPRSIQTTN